MNLLDDFDGRIDQTGVKLCYKIFAGVGDLLWRTALFRELKRRNPGMILIVNSIGPVWKTLYKNNPHIDELRELNDTPGELDDIDIYVEDRICPHVVTDYGRTTHAIDALGKWAGIEIYDKSYHYEVTEAERIWAKKFIFTFKPKKVVGIGLKASTWVRTWVPNETKRLIKMFLHNDYHVILMDTHTTELSSDNITSMCGGYSIRDVAAVIEQLDLLVCPDSGLMHFGGHFKIPTVAIFGATAPDTRIKYFSTVIPIMTKAKLECQPCFIHAFECPYGIPAPCLGSISAEQVFDEIKKMV